MPALIVLQCLNRWGKNFRRGESLFGKKEVGQRFAKGISGIEIDLEREVHATNQPRLREQFKVKVSLKFLFFFKFVMKQ